MRLGLTCHSSTLSEAFVEPYGWYAYRIIHPEQLHTCSRVFGKDRLLALTSRVMRCRVARADESL
jgi:hypothetical protein